MIHLTMSIDDVRPFLSFINLLPCRPSFDTRSRVTPMQYLLYIHRGKGQFVIGDKSYDASEGDMFYCSAGVPNRIIASQDDPFTLTGMDFTYTPIGRTWKGIMQHAPETFAANDILESVRFSDFEGFSPQLDVRSDATLHNRILEMADTFTRQRKHWQPQINGMFQAFLIRLVQITNQRFYGSREAVGSDDIIQYILNHYHENLPNERLAAHFHYHPDYVSRIVYAYTGLTLRQYIIDLRVRESVMLLISTHLPVESVAARVGYDNPQYFSRIFKQKTGHSPSEFRRFMS